MLKVTIEINIDWKVNTVNADMARDIVKRDFENLLQDKLKGEFGEDLKDINISVLKG